MQKGVEGYDGEDFMSLLGMIVHVFEENSDVLYARRSAGWTKVKKIGRTVSR